jgi:putative transposase
MKRRHTQAQILAIVQESDAGASTGELCRRYGIHPNTLRNWKAKFGGMTLSEVARLKQLEDENRRLKRIVADQALNIDALKFVASGNF